MDQFAEWLLVRLYDGRWVFMLLLLIVLCALAYFIRILVDPRKGLYMVRDVPSPEDYARAQREANNGPFKG